MSTTDTNDHIRSAVEGLQRRRLQHAALLNQLTDARVRFDEQNAPLIRQVQESQERLAEADRIVRELGAAHYEATGQTKPGFGVSVILTERAEIVDADLTMGWAQESGTGLTLDRKAIEKAAKAGLTIPGVEVTKEPAVRIASDLAEFLQDAPAVIGGAA